MMLSWLDGFAWLKSSNQIMHADENLLLIMSNMTESCHFTHAFAFLVSFPFFMAVKRSFKYLKVLIVAIFRLEFFRGIKLLLPFSTILDHEDMEAKLINIAPC